MASSSPMATADNELVVAAAAAGDTPLFGQLGSTSGSHPHSISSEGVEGRVEVIRWSECACGEHALRSLPLLVSSAVQWVSCDGCCGRFKQQPKY